MSRETLAKLSEKFGANPRLQSTRSDCRRSYYRPGTDTMHLKPGVGVNTILHEYAHALVRHRVLTIKGFKRDKNHHGKVYKKTLAEVVKFWYGGFTPYSWDVEYKSVRNFGKKLIERESKAFQMNQISISNTHSSEKRIGTMITVDKSFTLPEKVRRGKKEQYPFSTMTVTTKDVAGDSFFVADVDSPSGDAVKTLQRTAYSAEKRIAKNGSTVRFAVFPAEVEQNGVKVKGARVFRTE